MADKFSITLKIGGHIYSFVGWIILVINIPKISKKVLVTCMVLYA